ncbi:MAG: CinA family protein [Verrucomicrobia bacterium]|nr:CinA family protein [Verrucomicrobiota bacterium]
MKPERIERILNSGYRAAFVLTGGGSGALNALLSTPGASRFVTEAHVPYSTEALERFLGEKPEHSVSPATASKLAQTAVRGQDTGVLGISCSAALMTDRERRGDDRAFICIKTAESEKLFILGFSKTSRAEQEALLSDWLLVLIAQATGAERGLILSGSFNPVHHGHFNLLKVAEGMTGLRGVFELSCANVDKPMIEEADCIRRASAIKDVPVALTHAPRFAQKADLFPGTTFALGYDTAERLIAYAQPGEFEKFQALETKFLVAGRQHGGCFQTLENLALPYGFASIFGAVPESKFREDISSSELRNI